MPLITLRWVEEFIKVVQCRSIKDTEGIVCHKILHGIYDSAVSPALLRCNFSATRDKDLTLVKHYCRHNTRK